MRPAYPACWRYHRNPDRSTTFTSPTGHTYIDPPEAVTLPGEWLRNIPDTPRTAPSPTNHEHASTCQERAVAEPAPTTVGDHVRAYLEREKRRNTKTKTNTPAASTNTAIPATPPASPSAGPTTGEQDPTREAEERPPF